MTQSKKTDEYIITLDSGEKLDLSGIVDSVGDITINLDDTYGATTTYMADSSYSIGSNDFDTITISDGTFTLDTHAIDWTTNSILRDNRIDSTQVENMCEHYPGLEKAWRNFKAVYDMCKQDYEGKKKAGEIDDDLPF